MFAHLGDEHEHGGQALVEPSSMAAQCGADLPPPTPWPTVTVCGHCLRYGEVVVAVVDAGAEGVVLRDLDLRRPFSYYVYAIRYGVESQPEIGQLQ